ncbi:hypothetical protein CVT26_003558 [Gymnopilus dilepis]|uniref:Cytochrome P450 n=1 Tax=Gymnopilus dilepis TaxID=231916 RepID=A0A409VS76_9AGAR|nr:hypothetical protein CVT26_003558 [Gymnopilus dilepis]
MIRLTRRSNTNARLLPSSLDNVPGPKPSSWVAGNLLELNDPIKGWNFHKEIAKTYGKIVRIKGMFGSNQLYVYDPKVMQRILLKDQDIYDETETQQNGSWRRIGEKHRRQRKMLNPVFSIAHLRNMTPVFYEVAHKVHDTFMKKVKKGPQEIEVLGWMTRLALELIGQSGLGYSFDELTENAVPHEYGIASKQLGPTQNPKMMLLNKLVMPKLSKIGTPAFRRWVVEHIPSKEVQNIRAIVDTLHRTAVGIFESKKNAVEAGEAALEAQTGKGKDLISILLKENMKASEDDKLSDEEVLGQISTFTFAATDTTSTAISRTLHLLAHHKDAQHKLRQELRKAKEDNNGQDVGHDELVSLPYLDAVCRETLRLYSPVTSHMRVTRQDAVLPLPQPIKGINGKDIHELPLPKGTEIHLGVLNSNIDPELWGRDSEEWKPDRWLNPLPEALVDARIHRDLFALDDFPRSGFKFSQLEMKVVLALLIETFEFSPSDKDKEISWHLGPIAIPIWGNDQTKVALPLMVLPYVLSLQHCFSMSLSTYQVSACFLIAWACWRLLHRRLFPSALDNVPGPEPKSWLVGNMLDLHDPLTGWEYHKEIARNYGGVIRVKGMFGSNQLYVYDPKVMHQILLKDQYAYDENELFIESNKMIFGEGLLTTLGDKHRRQRKMLTPVFSIAHLRNMVPIFYEVARKVHDTFTKKVQQGPQEIEIMSWMTRLALELIGQSGLGYSFDELTENAVPHEYGIASKQLVPTQSQAKVVLLNRALLPKLTKIGTRSFRRWVVEHLPSKHVQKVRGIVDTLHRTSVEIFESKKKAVEAGDAALEAQIGRGKDLISILLKENMKASQEDKLSDEEVLGQITTFTFAATDTTSTAISRTLHLLAHHKDAQDRLRQELRKARQDNDGEDISYDALVSLPYLDAICRETLRLYSPVNSLMRAARQDVVLPLPRPIRGVNGEEIHELPLPKGTNIYLAVSSSNRNPELWGPDVEEWKPDRWLKPLPEALINARIPGIYSHLMTFLGGSRSCIGFKFSQLEMKVVLALLIETLEFSPSDKDKDIFWQMSGIVTPILDRDPTKVALPMMVSLAN